MEASSQKVPATVWWGIWAVVLGGLIGMRFFLETHRGDKSVADAAAGFISLVPLSVSVVLRWFVLPKQREGQRALVIFVLGLATAEAAGATGSLLGGEHRAVFFALGIAGVLQWVPVFARRFD